MTENTPRDRYPLVEQMEALRFAAALTYAWVMMILLGAIVLETVMIYPNVFSDPPESLELAMDFLSVRGPDDFFPPVGLLSWVLGAGALITSWRVPSARRWLLLSLAMIVGEGLVSVLYFWPRNEIMFVEGLAVHAPEYLEHVAREFESWHWRSRLGFNTAAAVAAFTALLRVHRHHLTRPGVTTAPGARQGSR